VMPDPFTNTNAELIIALAARYKVPAIFNEPFHGGLGGLISYGIIPSGSRIHRPRPQGR
jgi:putative tryptophan/tyrosine transport system substrate-binding protein